VLEEILWFHEQNGLSVGTLLSAPTPQEQRIERMMELFSARRKYGTVSLHDSLFVQSDANNPIASTRTTGHESKAFSSVPIHCFRLRRSAQPTTTTGQAPDAN